MKNIDIYISIVIAIIISGFNFFFSAFFFMGHGDTLKLIQAQPLPYFLYGASFWGLFWSLTFAILFFLEWRTIKYFFNNNLKVKWRLLWIGVALQLVISLLGKYVFISSILEMKIN